jgi:tetratricopeptide (TPR) repeat protein
MEKNQELQPFPLPLPPSLASYNDLFMREPQEAIKRLENQFRKREFDPVCSILLAWFYHEVGNRKIATEYAIKAKLYSPGSPLLMFSSYYLDHPEKFEAFVPVDVYEGEKPGFFVDRTLSLDELIERLSSGDNSKIVLNDGSTPASGQSEPMVTEGPVTEVFATETLATIYESHGELEKAAQVYDQLIASKPEKADYFRLKIESLRSAKN